MTFVERYQIADGWQEKVLVMSIFHSAATQGQKNWTIKQTASVFGVSVGLVSENLRLAEAIDMGSDITNCETRQNALNKIERRKTYR